MNSAQRLRDQSSPAQVPLASELATDRNKRPPIVAPYKEHEYLSSFPPIDQEIKVHPPLEQNQFFQDVNKLIFEEKGQPEFAPQELAYP